MEGEKEDRREEGSKEKIKEEVLVDMLDRRYGRGMCDEEKTVSERAWRC